MEVLWTGCGEVGQTTACRIQVVGSSEGVGRSDDYSSIKLRCLKFESGKPSACDRG